MNSVRTSSPAQERRMADVSAPASESVRSSAPARVARSWGEEVRNAVRDAGELCELLELPDWFIHAANSCETTFKPFVPHTFIQRIRRGDTDDPLLRQVLPIAAENEAVVGFSNDPVRDVDFTRDDGLIHKYHGRALLIAAKSCAVHCRYCFRREFPYENAPSGISNWRSTLDTIADDDSIREVILSGGDPLMLVDSQLTELIGLIAAIPHVQRLRIHTRLPVVIPARVTIELLQTLQRTRLTTYFVVHVNHANELDPALQTSLGKLIDAGIPVLNQAVLLRGVNDSVDALHNLFEQLSDARVLPYYLHQLDRVSGAAHFEVSIDRGIELMKELQTRLPGYALPRYVMDDGSSLSKRILF